jgi:ABC-type branched-subunit amino acid transport system substrate-binding protein
VTALRAALVTPLSGSFAAFGQAGAAGLKLWAERAAALPRPWTRVELYVLDAHPSAGAAVRRAAERQPHVIFGPYGSGPAIAAVRATEQMVWNHGGATDRLRWPAFAHVVNLLAPAASYFAAVLQAVHAVDSTARTVSLVFGATGFGREVARGALETGAQLGLEVQPHECTPGQAAAVARVLPPADVLLVAGSFADELALVGLTLERTYKSAAFVGAGVEEVLAPLGSARDGLLGPCQWLPRVAEPPGEGPDATWFVDAYHTYTRSDPPYPAGAAFAAGVLYARCLREAGTTEHQALLAFAQTLDVRTLFGRFRLDPHTGLQVGHQVLVVQWQQGERRVVWPPERAERPLLLRQI